MAYTRDQKRAIFDKYDGKCHICGGKIAFGSYGKSSPYAWEVDHLKAKARGGHRTHLNNLAPAHPSCNRSKAAKTNRTARARVGRTRAPLTKKERASGKKKQAVVGGLSLAAVGGAIGGPAGAFVGAAIGSALGHGAEPADPGIAPKKRCRATTKTGQRCGNPALPANRFCGVHRKMKHAQKVASRSKRSSKRTSKAKRTRKRFAGTNR